jgi:hypothetical protein
MGDVWRSGLERVKGIEPSYAAWEAAVLPLNYTRFIGQLNGGGDALSRVPFRIKKS